MLKSLLEIIFISILLIFFISFLWRMFAKRYSLPFPYWLGWLIEIDNPFTRVNRVEAIIQQLNVKKGMKVLDIGCGPGRLTIPLAQAVGSKGEVVAIDIQAGMIQQAQAKAHAAHLTNITFIHSGLSETKFPENKFDRVVLVTALGEITNREHAMQEIFNSLKPGGILAVTEIIFDPHYQSRKTIRRLASAVGLKEKQEIVNLVAYTLLFAKS